MRFDDLPFRRLVLCSALLFLLVVPAAAQSTQSVDLPGTSVIDIKGFKFPGRISGLGRNKKTTYNVPGAGFSVSYGEPGDTWADIYIYDREMDLPMSSANPLAKNELQAALRDVQTSVKLGIYQRADLVEVSTSGAFARAQVAITQNQQNRDSFLFVTARNGNFVKIRLTTGSDAHSKERAQRFLEDYSRVLQ
jgi:hypothetical protein